MPTELSYPQQSQTPDHSQQLNAVTSKQPLTCPVCDIPTRRAGHANYYTKESRFTTSIFHCSLCDVYCREVDNERLIGHYYAASYVTLSNEERFLRQRRAFFEYLLSSIDRNRPSVADRKPLLVDFGCSYGHLLQAAEKPGYTAVGIELNEDLVTQCRARGLNVQPSLAHLSGAVDVFTLIDSLYCVPNPREILLSIRRGLAPAGMLVIRVTNRNQYARIRNSFARDNDFSILGDCTIGYSHHGIRRLLASAGFVITH